MGGQFAIVQGRNEVRWRPARKPVWRPHVRTWGLSEANSLYWRKCMWHCWDFSAPSAVIRRSLQWLGAGELLPPCPSLVTPLRLSLTWVYYLHLKQVK